MRTWIFERTAGRESELNSDALWKRLEAASFLTTDEKRAAAGYDAQAEDASPQLKYREDQPRVPAGQTGGGQWTDGGDGGLNSADGLAQAGERSGYQVDILEEDKLGGHTFERHIAKTEEYLKARVLGSRESVPPPGGLAEKRAGSFTSLEAANKLTNSVLSDSENKTKLSSFVQYRFPFWLPVLYLYRQFKSPTGYEAYVPNERAQPVMRDTYSVEVKVMRTDESSKGFYVLSARPMNED